MLLVAAILASAFVLPTTRQPAGRPVSRVARMAAGNEAIDFPDLDGSEVRVGIIKARWHEDITDELVAGIKTALKECGVADENIVLSEVPGSFELPLATRYMALSGTVDAVIPVGLLIKGDTYHFEVIADTVTGALMNIGLSTGVPVIFGVLTTNTEAQAKDRSSGKNNHGLQWGKAAVEMALLRSTALGKKGRKVLSAFARPSLPPPPLVSSPFQLTASAPAAVCPRVLVNSSSSASTPTTARSRSPRPPSRARLASEPARRAVSATGVGLPCVRHMSAVLSAFGTMAARRRHTTRADSMCHCPFQLALPACQPVALPPPMCAPF